MTGYRSGCGWGSFVTGIIASAVLLAVVACTAWSAGIATEADPPESVIIDTAASSAAKLQGIPLNAVHLEEGLFYQIRQASLKRGMPAFLAELERAGAIEKVEGMVTGARSNSDADLAKWLEAAAYWMPAHPESVLASQAENLIQAYLASGKEGGYFHKRYRKELPGKLKSFREGGELYCLGHLIQAAIAVFRATGDRSLLSLMEETVNHLIADIGFSETAFDVPHPEIEMALVELYRVTRDPRHLAFARYLLEGVDLRKHPELSASLDFEHLFSGVPFTRQAALSNHAVCALYRLCGAADLYLETGSGETWQNLENLWQDLTQTKLYLTGGVGSLPQTESIGKPYHLPNETAYAETCAAIGNMMWNWRMLQTSGDARFMDLFERTLYNGMLSGISLEGDAFFYWNPLYSRADTTRRLQDNPEFQGRLIQMKKSLGVGVNLRQSYFNTPCCPPNILRMLASLPGYFYGRSEEGLWVHLYGAGSLAYPLESGVSVTLTQETHYPWEGRVNLRVEPETPQAFRLYLRIPGWCEQANVSLNGEAVSEPVPTGRYLALERTWKPGDEVILEFAMPATLVQAHPRVEENTGKAAMQRGPLVYCLESPDNQEFSLFDVVLPVRSGRLTGPVSTVWKSGLLGGLMTLQTEVWILEPGSSPVPLYTPFGRYAEGATPVTATWIPYFAWANRGVSDMRVWTPIQPLPNPKQED